MCLSCPCTIGAHSHSIVWPFGEPSSQLTFKFLTEQLHI